MTPFIALLWLLSQCQAALVSSSRTELCDTPRSTYRLSGDATITVLLDLHRGKNCSERVPAAEHQVAAALWTVNALNQLSFLPDLRLGLLVYDTCSTPHLARKALITAIAERECQASRSLGMVTTTEVSTAISQLATTLQIPVKTGQSGVEVPDLVAGLLGVLNRVPIVHLVLGSTTEILEHFSRSSAEQSVCIHNQALLVSNWTQQLSGEEEVIVAIGKPQEILNALEKAVNETTDARWILAPTTYSPNLLHSGVVPDNSLLIVPPPWASLPMTSNANASEAALVTGSPHFLQIAQPLMSVARACGGGGGGEDVPCTDNEETLQTLYELAKPDIAFYTTLLGAEQVATFHRQEDKFSVMLLADNSTFDLGEEPCKDNACRALCINFDTKLKEELGQELDILEIEDAEPWYFPVSWRNESWVAAMASLAAVGLTSSIAVCIFIVVRIAKGDVLEGNPSFSFLLLAALVVTYGSAVPFSLIPNEEYPPADKERTAGLLCGIRIFGTTVSYALLWSIMLSRSFMLASCDQEGGFMSHVNGYLQTVLCFFIAGVQLALSVQFWAINSTLFLPSQHQCAALYEGHLFLLILSYDFFLLLLLVCTSPFIARSKRNYREGMFFTVASVLCLLVSVGWSTAYALAPRIWRDAAVAGGLTSTATIILVTVFIPRTYLMMTGIVRDHLASALPTLAYTSTTSVQDLHYRSTQALYDTVVTPAPPHVTAKGTPSNSGQVNPNFYSDQPEIAPSPSPGQREFGASKFHRTPENTYERYDSPPSPHKVTRF